jgi:putative copper export protein
MVVPPLIGMSRTVVGMISAFQTIGNGSEAPEVLAEDVSTALMTTAGGLVISCIAFPIFVIALVMIAPPQSREDRRTDKNSLKKRIPVSNQVASSTEN